MKQFYNSRRNLNFLLSNFESSRTGIKQYCLGIIIYKYQCYTQVVNENSFKFFECIDVLEFHVFIFNRYKWFRNVYTHACVGVSGFM